MNGSFERIKALTKRNIKEIIRDPLSLIFMLAMPLVMEILFYLLFHDMTSQFGMKYLAPGIVVFSQSFLALFTGLLISIDRGSAFLTRLYVSKTKPYEFILSYALAVIPLTLFQSVLFFAVGGIIDSSIFGVGMVFCILLSVVTSLFFIGLGILFGSLCGERSVGGVSSVIITGQSLLSGMWFPVEGLGAGMLTVMKILPFKNATDLMQNVLNGVNDTFADFWLPLIIVSAYAAVIFAVACAVFKSRMIEK